MGLRLMSNINLFASNLAIRNPPPDFLFFGHRQTGHQLNPRVVTARGDELDLKKGSAICVDQISISRKIGWGWSECIR